MSASIAKLFRRSLPRLASQHSRHFAIQSVVAREVIDSRGNPTVEADVTTENGLFRASVPSGASTGIYEALELRDGDKGRFLGQGCLKACNNVNTIIAPGINNLDETDQQNIDDIMVQKLDGSKNDWGWAKENLGANAILAVSLAVARAGAASKQVPLYRHLADLSGHGRSELVMPVPSFNVINGGSHAGNALAMQEFMILPTGASSFKEAMQIGCEIYHHLKNVIKGKYGQDAINVGDEGGFAPNIGDNEEGLNLIMNAIELSGHTEKVHLGMDVAAAEFLVTKNNEPHYDLNFKEKDNDGSQVITGTQLSDLYKDFASKFPLVSMEDPFDQDDWDNYGALTKDIGTQVQIVGDDLLVTNPRRIEEAIAQKTCNALLLKVNQIGSVSESIEANNMSKEAGWGVMMSHRSGETEDSFIADLAVGLCTGQIKTGAPCRSERTAKLNQLMRIEEALGDNCVYAGADFRKP